MRSSLYLAGHEITATDAGATVDAARSYTFAGELTATRTSAGIDYLGVNEQGSLQTEVGDGQASPDAAQAYTPYGERRTTDDFTTQRGWLGQVEDHDIGLNYLNARYYDPNLATFISPDPLVDPNTPQTLNPYSYSLNNPTSGSDPSGLSTCGSGGKTPSWPSAHVRPA